MKFKTDYLVHQIYVLLWFWFVTLSTLSAIQLVWRVLSITSRGFREFMLRKQTNNMATVRIIKLCIDILIIVQFSGGACCHLLCQADHGGLVCPHADWGQY